MKLRAKRDTKIKYSSRLYTWVERGCMGYDITAGEVIKIDTDDFEVVIEKPEKLQEIEEFYQPDMYSSFEYATSRKLNELVKAVNQLVKEREQ